jgi:hypothetical protein
VAGAAAAGVIAITGWAGGTGGGSDGGDPGGWTGVKATVAGMAVAIAAIAIHVLRCAMGTSGRYAGMRVRYVTVMSVWLGLALHMVLVIAR